MHGECGGVSGKQQGRTNSEGGLVWEAGAVPPSRPARGYGGTL